jgi:hypothetical protein
MRLMLLARILIGEFNDEELAKGGLALSGASWGGWLSSVKVFLGVWLLDA